VHPTANASHIPNTQDLGRFMVSLSRKMLRQVNWRQEAITRTEPVFGEDKARRVCTELCTDTLAFTVVPI